jgi:hypothetical protein
LIAALARATKTKLKQGLTTHIPNDKPTRFERYDFALTVLTRTRAD